jgi:hypothetical protein
MLNRTLFCAALILAFVYLVDAQTNNGSLKGSVTDQLGSLITNARVVLKDERGASTSITTNQVGLYEFKNLRPGKYEVRVSVPGFVIYQEKDILVEARRSTQLDVQLTVELEEQQVTIDDRTVSTDSDNNANAIVLRGRDLEALPNDPTALSAALQALAGPTDPEGGGAQVKVDGFSNGQIPPKEAIREVRINNNPYSAENEFPGFNGIEIFTQPGSDKWHGGVSFDFNDESLNSRNPFTTRRAPYQQRSFGFNLSGPIAAKRASFSVYLYRYVSDSNSVVNATILDPVTLLPVTLNQSFVTPSTNTDGTARMDFKVNKKHTLVGRFSLWKSKQDLQGIGGFSLPSRAYQGERTQYTIQVTETALLNEKTVNETRVQFSRNNYNQNSVSTLPGLTVQDAFFGGGSQTGATSNIQQRFEIQNFTSWSQGKHFLKVGGRFRWVGIDSVSPGNFGGSYTFSGDVGPVLDANNQVVAGATTQLSSLERYRRTLLFQRQGLSPSAIRTLGGGATQFSIAGGNPKASVTQGDVAIYLQDEWRVTPHFTLSPGLRYENQNNVDSNLNFAPRLSFAWSPVFGSKKVEPSKPADPKAAAATPTDSKTTSATATSAPKAVTPVPAPTATAAPAAAAAPKFSGPPKTVFRGGIGFFYNRISEDLSLSALRFNGTTQQQFLVTDPTVLDLFPVVPAVSTLQSFAQPQSLRTLSDELGPSRSFRVMFTVERQLTKTIKLSTTYSHAHTFDTLRTVNINAPLGGTFIPKVPTSGVRPLGQSAGNIFQSQATGESVGNSLNINLNGNLKKVNFWGGFSFGKSRNRDGGNSGAPFDAYDFSREWARSGSLSFIYFGGYYQGPHGISLNLFSIANSGQPFNITTGQDTNGDTVFNERPAFATDLNKPGVVVTPLGAFDPNPTSSEHLIPRNFGRGPAFISVNLSAEKVFKFGKAIEPKTPPSPPKTTDANAPQTPQPKPPVQRPYTLGLSIYTSNLFNRTNRGNPVGNMASPYFLKSPGGSNTFFFGPGGGSGGNRTVNVRVRLSF